ncbi:DUF4836 family protein [uncultured Microscilla sp.]|uniref:DUF4836 family protein n=1 Tax=uncultured Microscilla sp. TaxID=432653 RepID=UPI00261D9ACE|nr:DUF4836 family protein [uncultured Microscilla sp.]
MVILKIHIQSLLLLTFTCVFFIQCSPTSEPQTHYIPVEATMVGVIDLKQLYFKADFKQVQSTVGFKKWQTTILSANKDLGSILLDNLQNPFASGINFERKVFVFDYPTNYLINTNRGILVALNSASKFEHMVRKWSKKLVIQTGKEDFKWVELEENLALGWNKKVAMLMISAPDFKMNLVGKPLGASAYLKKFFSLPAEKSLSKNRNFQAFIRKDNDLALWYNLEAVKQQMTVALKTSKYSKNDQQVLDEIFNFSDAYIHYELNFEKGKVRATAHYDLNDHLKKFYNKTYGKTLSPRLLAKLHHHKPIGFLGFSWNFSGLYDWLKRVEDVEQQFEKTAKSMKFTSQELLDALQGELMLAVTGYEKFEVKEKGSPYGDYLTKMLKKHEVGEKKLEDFRKRLDEIPAKVRVKPAPELVAVLSVKNSQVAQQLLKLLGQYTKLTPRKSYHQFQWMELTMYVAVRANHLVMSNQEKLVQNFWSKPQKPEHLGGLYKEATQYTGFGYFNFNFDEYSQSTQQHIKQQVGTKFGKLQEVLNLFDHIKAHNKGFDAEIELVMSNKKENSLTTLLNGVFNDAAMVVLAE